VTADDAVADVDNDVFTAGEGRRGSALSRVILYVRNKSNRARRWPVFQQADQSRSL